MRLPTTAPSSLDIREDMLRFAALFVLAVGDVAGFSISRMPALGLRGRAGRLGERGRGIPVLSSPSPRRQQATQMTASDSMDYLSSLSQTVDRTGDVRWQRADEPIRLDGVTATSLTVGIPKEVHTGECRVAVSVVRV